MLFKDREREVLGATPAMTKQREGGAAPLIGDGQMDAIFTSAPNDSAADKPAVQTAALCLGCVALLMLGVQPLVLGAQVTVGRLDVQLLALAAMVEMLALGVVSGAMGALAPHRNLVGWAAGGCILLVAGNVGCMQVTGLGLVALRGVTGSAGGVLVWIAGGVIGRSRSGLRLAAIFSGAQALSQAVLAALIPLGVPSLGAGAGFAFLALAGVVCAPLIIGIPRDLPDLPAPEEGHARLGVAGLLGLGGAFLLMAGIVGVWVFVEQIASQHGLAASTISLAVAASLAMQIVGAVFITVIGPRVRAAIVLPVICFGYIVCVAVMGLAAGPGLFVAAILAFGFLWTCSLPLFLPLLVTIDPTRRSAMLLGGAQLLGGSAGPLITGLLVRGADLHPVLSYGAGLFLASALAIGLAVTARPSP